VPSQSGGGFSLCFCGNRTSSRTLISTYLPSRDCAAGRANENAIPVRKERREGESEKTSREGKEEAVKAKAQAETQLLLARKAEYVTRSALHNGYAENDFVHAAHVLEDVLTIFVDGARLPLEQHVHATNGASGHEAVFHTWHLVRTENGLFREMTSLGRR